MKFTSTAAGLLFASLVVTAPASPQVNMSGYALPSELAVKAAEVAVRSCAVHNYYVTAIVVDTAGLVIVQIRGDHATVHTKDSAYRKAYTVISMGPIFGFDRSGEFASILAKAPAGAGPALADVPNVIALPGAVAIKRGSETVAALGVGGAPGGNRDEACAADGVAAIADQIK